MFHNEKSWYDLSVEETNKLEKEFISNDMGKVANDAMHICVITGIMVFVFNAIILSILLLTNCINPYSFTILILFIIFGLIIVVSSTIEYHIKFNSWLKVTKKIIKK